MKVDLYASLSHYLDHLAPVWWEMLSEERGTVYVGDGLEPTQWALGEAKVGAPPPGDTLTLVAGYRDHRAIVRPTILVEHGAGQHYPADPRSRQDPSYSGGAGWDACRLFLSPHERVAARWRLMYPAPVVSVGCPKLDAYHRAQAARARDTTVAFTWHWDCRLIPETTTAWGHYAFGLPAVVAELQSQGIRVIGSVHPRMRHHVDDTYRAAGVELVDDKAIMEQADVLCADNTSLLPEFASLGRPVVWVNAPQWRRDVDHGGRFWDWPAGQPTVDEPEDLRPAIERALEGRPRDVERREAMVGDVYAYRDGRAARRAVEAMREL